MGQNIIMIIVYIIFTTSGALLIKAGAANPLSLSVGGGTLGASAGLVTVAGLALYLVSFLLWTRILAANDISWVVPVTTGIVQVIMMTGAILFFHEPVSSIRLIGAAIVICGVIVMNLKPNA